MGVVLGRIGTTKLIALGLSALLAGYVLFLRVGPNQAYANFLLPTMLLLGIGFALCFPAVNAQATSGVADHEQGLASGLLNTSMQIGGAVVLAVVTAILSSAGSSTSAKHGELLPGMLPALGVVVGVSVAGLLLTAARLRPRRSQLEFALAD
jgi:MFS family permease